MSRTLAIDISKTDRRNAYSASVPTATQEARPLENDRGVRCLRTEPSASWEPRSMQQSELDDFTFAGEHPWRDEELLRELYIDRQMSTVEVGERLGCAGATVHHWLCKHDIPVRSRRESQNPAVTDEDRLRRLYCDENLTAVEIGERFDCGKTAVLSALRHFGIERRGSGPRSLEDMGGVPAESDLRELYIEGGKSISELAGHFNRSTATIFKLMGKYGIETREYCPSGEDSYVWEGGYEGVYGPSWRRQRRRARERDGHMCRSCGMSSSEHKEEWGCELHVHHIRRHGDFDSHAAANVLSNLITLCQGCHSRLEGVPIDNGGGS